MAGAGRRKWRGKGRIDRLKVGVGRGPETVLKFRRCEDVKSFTILAKWTLVREIVGPIRAAALALEFGFVVGSFIVTGVLLGRYLDGLWGTAPWIFMTGVLLGLGLSFYVMVLIFNWQRE